MRNIIRFILFMSIICALAIKCSAQSTKVPQKVNSWYEFWGVSHDSLDIMMNHVPVAPYNLPLQRWYNTSDSAIHWYTPSLTDRNTNTTWPQSLSYGRSFSKDDSALLGTHQFYLKNGTLNQDSSKVRIRFFVGDTVQQYGIDRSALFFGYSITNGFPGPPTVDLRYSAQVSPKIGCTEVNLGINSTTLVQLSSGDSSMQNRFSDIPNYSTSLGLISFEYTVNDANLNVDTARYSRVWDSTINTECILLHGWPPGKILVIAGTIVGINNSGSSPGAAKEAIYAGIAAREAAKFGVHFVLGQQYQTQVGGTANLISDSLHLSQEGHNTLANLILSALDSVNYASMNQLVVWNRFQTQFCDATTGSFSQVNTNNISVTGNYQTHGNFSKGISVIGDATGSARQVNIFNNANNVFGFGEGAFASIPSSTFDIYYPSNNIGVRFLSYSVDGLFTPVPKFTIGTDFFILDPTAVPNLSSITNADSFSIVHSVAGGQALYKTPLSTVYGIMARQTPTTGGTVVTLPGFYIIVDPAGPIATATIQLPSSPADGNTVELKITQPITTLSWTNGTIVNPPTTNVSGYIKIRFLAATSSWY